LWVFFDVVCGGEKGRFNGWCPRVGRVYCALDKEKGMVRTISAQIEMLFQK